MAFVESGRLRFFLILSFYFCDFERNRVGMLWGFFSWFFSGCRRGLVGLRFWVSVGMLSVVWFWISKRVCLGLCYGRRELVA